MATLDALHHDGPVAGSGFAATVRRSFAGIASVFAAVGEARACASEYDRLAHLSDARLAELGIARNEIATYVFNKHMA